MVRQDPAIVPKMTAEGKLQRSSWKAEAIRRGDLKISGPIPIDEDTPLTEEEERQFAAKHELEILAPETESPSQKPAQLATQTAPEAESDDTPEAVEADFEKQEAHHELRHKRSSSAIRETSEAQKQSDMQPSHSTPTPLPSVTNGSTQSTPKKKQKGRLKGILQKMFGRKSKDMSPGAPDRVLKHAYHQSDPGVLARTPEQPKPATAQRARISDMPVSELKPLNPLGQHLPFPMNVNAPQEVSPPQQYETVEPRPALHQRRATLPSVVLAPHEVQPQSVTWGHVGQQESLPSPEIGVALSSPTRRRRRSQSAGAIRELAKELEFTERRRSQEIKFWRQSSIYSTATPRPMTAATFETVDIKDTAPKESSEDPDCRMEARGPLPLSQQGLVSVIHSPVGAFDFGSLKSVKSHDEFSEAARSPIEEPHSAVEEPVVSLENTIHSLSTSVRRVSGQGNRHTIILESAPRDFRSRNRSVSNTSSIDSSTSDNSSNDSTSSKTLSTKEQDHDQQREQEPSIAPLEDLDTLDTSAFPTPPTTSPITHRHPLSPLEPSLIPHNPSAPPVDPADQFAAVYTILKHERAARKALEQQVLCLQQEIADLRSLVHNRLLSGTAEREHVNSYPTPSPDAIGMGVGNEDRTSTPRASRRLGRQIPDRVVLGFANSHSHHNSSSTVSDYQPHPGHDSEEENRPPVAEYGSPGYRRERKERVDWFPSDDEDDRIQRYASRRSSKESRNTSKESEVTSPDVWATPTEGEYKEFVV